MYNVHTVFIRAYVRMSYIVVAVQCVPCTWLLSTYHFEATAITCSAAGVHVPAWLQCSRCACICLASFSSQIQNLILEMKGIEITSYKYSIINT